MVQGGAAGLPPLFAETLLGLPMKAEFPADASANRAAIPAPHPSSYAGNIKWEYISHPGGKV
jgi:hypothetical protein